MLALAAQRFRSIRPRSSSTRPAGGARSMRWTLAGPDDRRRWSPACVHGAAARCGVRGQFRIGRSGDALRGDDTPGVVQATDDSGPRIRRGAVPGSPCRANAEIAWRAPLAGEEPFGGSSIPPRCRNRRPPNGANDSMPCAFRCRQGEAAGRNPARRAGAHPDVARRPGTAPGTPQLRAVLDPRRRDDERRVAAARPGRRRRRLRALVRAAPVRRRQGAVLRGRARQRPGAGKRQPG